MVSQRVPALTESYRSSTSSSWSASLDQSPSHRSDWSGDGCDGSGVGFLCLHFVDEGLDGRELVRQLAKVGLQGVELLVQVIQSLRQRWDPEKEKK